MKNPATFSQEQERRFVPAVAVMGAVGLFLMAWFFSAVWQDEICYTDPAANLASGRGFVSSVWPGQPADAFFASNTPLHPWLLAGLFWLGGFHREWVQGLNVVLWVVACLLFWLAARRFSFPRTSDGRVLFFLLALFSSGGFYAAGFGRYDAVGMAAVGLTAWVASWDRGARRGWVLFACGVLLPWAGLQLVALAVVMGTFLFVIFLGKPWRELAVGALGIATGVGLLFLLYSAQGVSEFFRHHALGKGGLSTFPWRVWTVHQCGGVLDPTLIAMTIVALGMTLTSAVRQGLSRTTILAGLAVLAAVVVSQGLLGLGRFPLYYSWMAVIPVAACLSAAVESQPEPGTRRGLWIVVLIVGILWLPIWLVLASSMRERRDLAPVERVVEQVVKKSDVVVVDFSAYYAVFPRAQRLYSADYITGTAMSEAEKNSVTLLFVRPSRVPELRAILGGDWEKQPESLVPPVDAPLPLNCWDYQIEVWRRNQL